MSIGYISISMKAEKNSKRTQVKALDSKMTPDVEKFPPLLKNYIDKRNPVFSVHFTSKIMKEQRLAKTVRQEN